jgi:hypothetical protein
VNRRAFILAVFGAAALELGAAPDLATPHRMPTPDPPPDPQKWYRPYCYLFETEFTGQEWTRQEIAIQADFFVNRAGWVAPDGAVVELAQDVTLCRAYLQSGEQQWPLAMPLFVPAGTSLALKAKNAIGNFGRGRLTLVLLGSQEITEATARAVMMSESIDAEFEDGEQTG